MADAFHPTRGAGFILRLFYHWFIIFRNYQGMERLWMYATAYCLSLKKMLASLLGVSWKGENILGFTVSFLNYAYVRSLFYEIFAAKLYAVHLPTPSPVIIDCGGNIGMSVLFFKYTYPDARITVFEPHKQTYDVLCKNIAQNNLHNVQPYNAAVASKSGKITLYVPHHAGPGDMTILRSHDAEAAHVDERMEVAAVRLSDFITGPVDLLKMDIEGSEGVVLQDLDARKKMHYVKNIIFEYHHNREQSNDIATIFSLLRRNGFAIEIQSIRYPPLDFYKNKQYALAIYAHKE